MRSGVGAGQKLIEVVMETEREKHARNIRQIWAWLRHREDPSLIGLIDIALKAADFLDDEQEAMDRFFVREVEVYTD